MKTLYLATLAVLTAGLSLHAESTRLGVQGTVNLPLSDLKAYTDGKPGPGVGLHVTFDLHDGHMIRPRLDFNTFPEASFTTIKQSVNTLSLGADYLYFIAEKPERFYFVAGLSAVQWSFHHDSADVNLTSSSRTTKFGIAAGVGYQLNATLGIEARWLHSSVSNLFSASSLQGGVTVRF